MREREEERKHKRNDDNYEKLKCEKRENKTKITRGKKRKFTREKKIEKMSKKKGGEK